jgi:hypothetical protein
VYLPFIAKKQFLIILYVFMQKKFMKNLVPVLLIATMAIGFVSCQKDKVNPTGSNPLVGNWKFTGLGAATESSYKLSDGFSQFKTVTLSDYATINNGGTIAITSNTLAGAGISYQINDVANTYTYEDDVLLDSTAFPLNFTLPPANSSSNYQLIGQDSLYFNGQCFFNTGSSALPPPEGARFTINGNILKITSAVLKDSSSTDSGVTQFFHQAALVVITMEKQ